MNRCYGSLSSAPDSLRLGREMRRSRIPDLSPAPHVDPLLVEWCPPIQQYGLGIQAHKSHNHYRSIKINIESNWYLIKLIMNRNATSASIVHIWTFWIMNWTSSFWNLWTELWTSSCRKWTFPTLTKGFYSCSFISRLPSAHPFFCLVFLVSVACFIVVPNSSLDTDPFLSLCFLTIVIVHLSLMYYTWVINPTSLVCIVWVLPFFCASLSLSAIASVLAFS